MKVILIKDCKEGKANQVVEVSDGYAKNFLIKQGFAMPHNSSTNHALTKTIEKNNAEAKAKLDAALELKTKLESQKFTFSVKVTNMVVHDSITRKQLLQELHAKGYKSITQFDIDSFKVGSLGISLIPVRLHKDVIAKVQVEVKQNGK